MSVNLVPEDQLRAALRPYRVDPEAFEATVRQRLQAAARQREDDPLAGLSPLLRSAAACLPLQVITGSKSTAAAAKLVPAGGYKLLSYAAFPAISLFVLLGATVFSIAKIRSIRNENGPDLADEQAMREGILQWWRCHKWGAWSVFAGTLGLTLVGATWLLFLMYIISFGLLLYVLTSLARVGLGNRRLIGPSCLMGLMFLGQISMLPQIGAEDIHFVDQMLVAAVFLGGTLVLLPFVLGISQLTGPRTERMLKLERLNQRTAGAMMLVLLVPLIAWLMHPILWPATRSRIKSYVESFEKAPYATSSWQRWEIVASWAIKSKLDPDLTRPRRLLSKEISGEQNPYILGTALRTGLIGADQLGQLKDDEKQRRVLLDDPQRLAETRPILSPTWDDWAIRASVLRNDLTPAERDYLEKRLNATLEDLSKGPYNVLETALRVTQLLEAIERPVDRDRYRDKVHDWLRSFHTKQGGGFQLAGGFKQDLKLQVASLESTSYAVELMEIYGVPDNLDLNWVRSFLRPSVYRFSDDKWIAAATYDRLNHLPGATQPTWLEVLYYERSLLAAMVLVGLCIYATLSSPKPKVTASADGLDLPIDDI